MKNNEIKPCPFCGKEARYYEDEGMISCIGSEGACNFYFNTDGYFEKTLEQWNRRAEIQPTPVPSDVKELEVEHFHDGALLLLVPLESWGEKIKNCARAHVDDFMERVRSEKIDLKRKAIAIRIRTISI